MTGKIAATIGREQHTTSAKWANLSINGVQKSHRDAISKEWLSKFGDKHASWCECVFAVQDGDIIEFEAGHNHGSRGSIQERTHLIFEFSSGADVREVQVAAGTLKGRLLKVADRLATQATAHDAMANDL